MPRPATSSQRCIYAENGRQCRRNGTGDPPICQAHRIAWQQAAQNQPSRGEAIFDVLETLFTGGRVSKTKFRAAAKDARGLWDEYRAAQGQAVPAGASSAPRPAPGARAQPPPPPRPDPLAESRRRFMAAKVELGFAESEPITAEMVNERRKVLAKRYHPDRQGGSLEKMTRINAAADELLSHAA